MRISHLLIAAAVSMSAMAQEKGRLPTKADEDVRECNKQAEAAGNDAVAKAKMRSPDNVTEIKRKAKIEKVIQCLREAGHTTGPIRGK